MKPITLRPGAPEPREGDALLYGAFGWEPQPPRARAHDTLFVNTESIVHIVQGPYQSPDFVSGSAGWKFSPDGSLEANDITARGTIYASAGEIGGFTITATTLYAGSGGDRVGLLPGSYPFYAGHETPASAPFRVAKNGDLVATSATITGTITATAGAIGGWAITATEIKSGANIVLDSSVPSIVIGANGYIRSSNYVSGFDGFHIDDDFAEFGNVQVRGSLHCAVFVKDLISAHAGSLLVTKSAGKLSADYTTAGTMTVETPPGGGWLFDTNDVIRIKEEYASGVHESWATVTRTGTINQYTTALSSGDSTTYHQGTTAVDYGVSGDGGLLQTADMANAPWMSVFTHAGAPWTTLTHHLRLGNLNGVGDYSSDKYGIFIGDYSGNKWMSYDPTNSLRIRGDAVIDGTIAATTFTNDVGALLFSQADGLLLLGPSCEINDGEWWSLRKQKATITGAFHQGAGRWLGTRGLVIEEATTNLHTNPSVETGTTGWSTTGYRATAARSTEQARFGSYSHKITTGSPSDNWYIGTTTAGLSGIAVNGSTTYTISGWVMVYPGHNTFARLEINEYDAAGVYLGVTSSSGWCTNGSGFWERLTKTLTTNVLTTFIEVRWRGPSGYGAGCNLYVDAMQIEQEGCATTYCDGSLGHDYAWSGTAHASTSTRAVTEVNLDAHAQLVTGNTTVSFRVSAQMPYDFDADWPNATLNYLSDAHDAGTSGRMRLVYRADTHVFELMVSDGVDTATLSSAVQSFKAGDWVDVVYTCSFAAAAAGSYILYVNGVVEDTDTTANVAAPTLTQWNLGSTYVASAQGGFTFSGYAAFDKILSAAEVAAMFALQRPLVDAGSLDSSGIYILDGRFRMASSLTGNRIEIDADEIAGYNSSGTKQFYLRASDGVAMAGAGAIILNSLGKETHGTGDADIYDKWYNEDITTYSDAFGFANLQKTDPNSNTYGVMNFGIRHDATNQSNIACWLNEVDLVVQKAGSWRYLLEANYDYVRITGVPFRVGTGVADPTVSIEDGMMFYRTDTGKLRLRAGGAWVNLN